MKIKPSQALAMIPKCIQAKLVPMLVGSPGCGKSQIIKQVAAEYGLKVIDLRLSQCDPTDLSGFPNIKGNKAGYVPMDTFPIEGDPIPEGFNGWLLFLDEFNSASPAVQAAAYKIVLDRMVGLYHLHKNVAIVCAGNLETDNAIVNPMSTAMQSRLVHFELVVDFLEWINWASESGINYKITGYLNHKPGNLYDFMPDHTDSTYACPRTWEMASRIMNITEPDDPNLLPLLAGTVSEGKARELMVYTKIYASIPKIPDIVAKPLEIIVPDEPSVIYAITGAISHNANENNIVKLMEYVKRLPMEFQVVCVKETVRRQKLGGHSAIQKWISTSAAKLY